MSKPSSLGAFTPQVLFMHSRRTGETSISYLKRALILFDKLVLFPEGLGDMGGPQELMSKQSWIARFAAKEDAKSAPKLNELIILDRDLISDVESFHKDFMYGNSEALWSGENSRKFVAFVEQMVDNDNTIEDKWEAKKFFVGNIDHDWRLFRAISTKFNDCTGLLSDIHEQAVLATLGEGTPNPNSVVRDVEEINSIDFGQLSWDNIFRLRKSGFVTDYRKAIAEWAVSYGKADNPSNSKMLLSKIIEDAKFELIGNTEPNVRETALISFGSNLPTPLWVNPISISAAFRDIAKQKRLKDDFGWLYFIQHSRKIASEKND